MRRPESSIEKVVVKVMMVPICGELLELGSCADLDDEGIFLAILQAVRNEIILEIVGDLYPYTIKYRLRPYRPLYCTVETQKKIITVRLR